MICIESNGFFNIDWFLYWCLINSLWMYDDFLKYIFSVTSWMDIGILEHDMGGKYQKCRVAQEGAQDTLYANYIRTLITYCAKTLMRTQASAMGSINVKSKSDFGQPSYKYIKILCICIFGVYIYRYNGIILYMFVCFIWWCIYIGDEWNPSTSIFWISISPLQPFMEILLNQASFHEIWSRVDED